MLHYSAVCKNAVIYLGLLYVWHVTSLYIGISLIFLIYISQVSYTRISSLMNKDYQLNTGLGFLSSHSHDRCFPAEWFELNKNIYLFSF